MLLFNKCIKKCIIFKLIIVILTCTILFSIYQFFILPNNFEEFTTNEWIFNCNVSQYSSIMRETLADNNRSKLIKFESTIFSDLAANLHQNLDKNLQCAILTDKKEKVYSNLTNFLSISLMGISVWKKSRFYRVECELKVPANANTRLFKMAIVDTRYLADSVKMLHMQAPMIVNTLLPKSKSIASCVHMLRDLNEKRVNHTLHWIKIQKIIGIAKIRIYLMEQNELLLQQVEKNYKDLVEIVVYNTKLNQLCDFQLKNKIQNSNSEFFNKLYDNCVSSVEKHFNMQDLMVSNSHERLQSNDCFLKFKYIYEYVVNYDIDEFILPRQIELDYSNSQDCKLNSIASKVQISKYSLYNFVKSITTNSHKNQVNRIIFLIST